VARVCKEATLLHTQNKKIQINARTPPQLGQALNYKKDGKGRRLESSHLHQSVRLSVWLVRGQALVGVGHLGALVASLHLRLTFSRGLDRLGGGGLTEEHLLHSTE